MKLLLVRFKRTHEKKASTGINVDIDIRFLFALLSSFIILWVYLLDNIIKLTESAETWHQVIPLSFFHYTVFVFLLLSIALLFYQGLTYLPIEKLNRVLSDEKERTQKAINFCKNVMLRWWLIFFIGGFLASVFSFFFRHVPFSFIILGAYLLAFLMHVLVIGNYKHLSVLCKKNNLIHLVLFFLGAFVYIPVMIILFADISVRTDKEFYAINDVVRVEIKTKGYVCSPKVKEISFNNDRKLPEERESFSFRIEKKDYLLNSKNYIKINFHSLGCFSKEKYYPIRITEE